MWTRKLKNDAMKSHSRIYIMLLVGKRSMKFQSFWLSIRKKLNVSLVATEMLCFILKKVYLISWRRMKMEKQSVKRLLFKNLSFVLSDQSVVKKAVLTVKSLHITQGSHASSIQGSKKRSDVNIALSWSLMKNWKRENAVRRRNVNWFTKTDVKRFYLVVINDMDLYNQKLVCHAWMRSVSRRIQLRLTVQRERTFVVSDFQRDWKISLEFSYNEDMYFIHPVF